MPVTLSVQRLDDRKKGKSIDPYKYYLFDRSLITISKRGGNVKVSKSFHYSYENQSLLFQETPFNVSTYNNLVVA